LYEVNCIEESEEQKICYQLLKNCYKKCIILIIQKNIINGLLEKQSPFMFTSRSPIVIFESYRVHSLCMAGSAAISECRECGTSPSPRTKSSSSHHKEPERATHSTNWKQEIPAGMNTGILIGQTARRTYWRPE
jgi:hypothetical protein